MKHTTLLIAFGLCLLLAVTHPSQAGLQASSDEVDFNAVDEYIRAQMRTARIPGLAVVIVKGDQIVFQKGYGRADPSGRPVTPQTSFIIGSVSKSFTALAVMQLVEAGKIELDAPVQRYIPWFRVADPQASAQITTRQYHRQCRLVLVSELRFPLRSVSNGSDYVGSGSHRQHQIRTGRKSLG